MTRQSFSPEFKREAVRLTEKGDKDGSQLAHELGIRCNMLYKWQAEINQRGADAFPGSGGRPKKSDDTRALNAEIQRERIRFCRKLSIKYTWKTAVFIAHLAFIVCYLLAAINVA